MSTLIPNTLQYPNFYVDELMHLLTPEENIVLMFSSREILGWDDKRQTRKARISVSVFSKGYEFRGKKLSGGTGLSENTVIDCLKSLCKYRILIRFDSTADGTEYEINFDPTRIDLVGLDERLESKKETYRKRTKKMRERIGVSDIPPGGAPDIPPGGVWCTNNETKETKETNIANLQVSDTPKSVEHKNDDRNIIDFPTPIPRESLTVEQRKQRTAEAARIGEENARSGKKKGISNPHDAKFSPVELECGKSIALALGRTSCTDFDCTESRRLLAKDIPAEKIIYFCSANAGEYMSVDKKTNARWVYNAIDEWQASGYPDITPVKIEVGKDGGFYA